MEAVVLDGVFEEINILFVMLDNLLLSCKYVLQSALEFLESEDLGGLAVVATFAEGFVALVGGVAVRRGGAFGA